MKVKFCPCCRGSVKFVTERKCYGHGEYPLIGYIMCNNCHLRSGDEIIDGFYGTKTTVQDVVDKWNNRISSSAR